MRGDAFELLGAMGVIPVVEVHEPRRGAELVRTLVEAGLPGVEITFRSPRAAAAIAAAREVGPEVLVLAGTVRKPVQVDEARDAGADCLVSPGLDPAVVERAIATGMPMLPGVCTPGEVERAVGYGLSAVKVFPAEPLGGVSLLKSLDGPFREVRWCPSGGISDGNLREYLALPSVLACGSGWIAPPADIDAGAFDAIGARARAAREIVTAARGTMP